MTSGLAGDGPMSIRVVLADDQPLIRAGLCMVIADIPDVHVVGEAGTGAQAIQLARELRPDAARARWHHRTGT